MSEIDFQQDRGVVLPGSRTDHLGFFHPVLDPVADQEIVDSPSGVIDLAGLDPLRPGL